MEIEYLPPNLPELRKPDPKIYSAEQIQKFEEESKKIAAAYQQFGEDEILDKILMLSDELQKIDYIYIKKIEDKEDLKKVNGYLNLKRKAEDDMIELNEIHKFIKYLKPGDENKIKITFTNPSDETKPLRIRGEYAIFKILDLLNTLNPGWERQRGGQAGGGIRHRIIQDFARDMYSWYRRFFRSDNAVFRFIGDLIEVSDYHRSIVNIKKLIDKKNWKNSI